MVTAPDARRVARAAAYGGAGLVGVSAAAAGLINAQRQQAKRVIGPRRTAAPYDDGRYGRSKGPSRRLVMIGDSITDLSTARAAGAPCILVSFGYTPVPAAELGADAVLDDFAALPDALRDLKLL